MIVYKTIERFPDYRFGSDGSIWSKKYGYWRQLKPTLSTYYQVYMYYNGIRELFNVHTLICEAFNGPCPKGLECLHKNGINTDVRSDNLHWGTHKQNMLDKKLHGTEQIGPTGANVKITIEQFKRIKYLLFLDLKHREIAKMVNTTLSTVRHISCGETWSSIQ